MKKAVIIVVWIVLFGIPWGYAQKKQVDPINLPEKAKGFLKTYFANFDISSAKAEIASWFNDKVYKVRLEDGREIDFDQEGNWKEVGGRRLVVPASLIPESILQYLRRSFPNTNIMKLKKEKRKYEVIISNGLELEFDRQGKFLRIDD